VTGVDQFPLGEGVKLDNFLQHDLNTGVPPIDLSKFQYIVLLDIVEHLLSPERFIEKLHEVGDLSPDVTIFVSTGNVGFVLTRVGLLLGMFNYGKRGILDVTHTRLFTFATIRRLFEQRGFDVVNIQGVPVPFPLALSNKGIARLLLAINCMLIRLWPSLFAFQSFLAIKPRPSLAYLLQQARIESEKRGEVIEKFAACGVLSAR
jgi:hypothetical protein